MCASGKIDLFNATFQIVVVSNYFSVPVKRNVGNQFDSHEDSESMSIIVSLMVLTYR
jgi:hypothetical protein